VKSDLPFEWPSGLEVSSYNDFLADSDGTILTFSIEGGNFMDNSTRAVAEKTWDAFLNGSLAEPILWYPSSQYYTYNWTYDVQLRPDASNIYLDFNATSEQTNMNATNISPVFFSATDGTTSLDSFYVQEVVDQIWDDFQNGTWGNNATYGFNNQTAIRMWTFTEEMAPLELWEKEN